MNYPRVSFLLLAVLSGALSTGCNRLPDTDSFADALTVNAGSNDVGNSYPNANPQPAAEASLAPSKSMTDKNGNLIKAIVVKHGASLFAGPSGNETVKSTELMDKYFVFEMGESRLRVGMNPRLNAQGFLSLNDVVLTSHMQLGKFNSDTLGIRQPIQGFSSFEDVKDYVAGKPVQPAVVESQLGGNLYKSYMPILDSRQLKVGSKIVDTLQLGAWTLRQEEQTNAVHAKPQKISREQMQQLQKYRLVLCIDGTSSMTTAWEVATKHIKSIFKQVLGDTGMEIEIAIVMYRDKDEHSIFPLKSSKFTSDLGLLETWVGRLKPRGGGDWPELMIAGLEEATKLLIESDQTAFKTILLVGDNASHVQGDSLIGTDGERVVETCRSNAITINALQLPYHETFQGDKDLLPDQLKKLTQETGGSLFTLAEEDYDQQSTASAISQTLLQSKKDALFEQQIAEEINAGSSREVILERTGLPETALQWRLASLEKRTEGRLRLSDNLTLGIDKIWVVLDPRAMDFAVLCPNEELELLITVLDRLLTVGVEKPSSMSELAAQLASRHLGEDLPFSELLRANGLPIRDGGILGLSPSELAIMPRSQRIAFAAEVQKRYEALINFKQANRPENGNWIIPTSVLP